MHAFFFNTSDSDLHQILMAIIYRQLMLEIFPKYEKVYANPAPTISIYTGLCICGQANHLAVLLTTNICPVTLHPVNQIGNAPWCEGAGPNLLSSR